MIHTEVEFVEMYERQPLFAEVDQFLRGNGFVFHRFSSLHGRFLDFDGSPTVWFSEGVYPPFHNSRKETLELESNRIRD